MQRAFRLARNVAVFLAVVVLFGTSWVLHEQSWMPLEGREALAARVERGGSPLDYTQVARLWQSELSAKRHVTERDRALSRILLGVGLLVVVTAAGTALGSRRVARMA